MSDEAGFETSKRGGSGLGAGCFWAVVAAFGLFACVGMLGSQGGGSSSSAGYRSPSDLVKQPGTAWPTFTFDEKQSVAEVGVDLALEQSIGAVSKEERQALATAIRGCIDQAAMAFPNEQVADYVASCATVARNSLRGG